MENLENGWIVENRDEEDIEYCTCHWCGSKIYYYEEYYDFDGDKVCVDCVRDCRKTAGE